MAKEQSSVLFVSDYVLGKHKINLVKMLIVTTNGVHLKL